MLYYLFCSKMGQNSRDFYETSMANLINQVNMWADEQRARYCAMQGDNYKSKYFNDARTVQSLHEIEGLF